MSTNTMAEDSVTPTSEIVCTPVQDTVISFQTTPVDDENSVSFKPVVIDAGEADIEESEKEKKKGEDLADNEGSPVVDIDVKDIEMKEVEINETKDDDIVCTLPKTEPTPNDGNGTTIKNPDSPGSPKPEYSTSCFKKVFGPGSVGGAVFNLCSATLGAGALSIPSSIHMTGWALGIILLIIGAFISIFTIDLMIIARRASGYASFESLAEHLFGKLALLVVNILIVFFCMGTAIGYVIAIRDIFSNVVTFDILPSWLNNKITLTIIFWTLFMCPLSCLRSMDSLKFSSFAGVVSVAYVVITTIVLCIRQFSFDQFDSVVAFRWSFDIMTAIPIMLFAFSSQVNVYEIQTPLRKPIDVNMKRVNRRSIPITATVYLCMGVAGYWAYKDNIKGNILLNFVETPDPFVILAFFAITFTIVMAFPLNIFPTRFTVTSIFWGTKAAETMPKTPKELVRHYSISIILCVICLIVGLTVDDLSIVFSLTGGIASSLLCFAFPGVCCLYLERKRKLRMSPGLRVSCYILIVAAIIIGILSIVTLFV